jgi:hypothetical protein
MSNIVYNLEDAGKFINSSNAKYKGMWSIGTKIHDAHIEIYKIIKEKCDYIIGCYFNTWHAMIHDLTGIEEPNDHPLYQDTIDQMSDLCDILIIYTGNYFGYEQEEKGLLLQKVVSELPNINIPSFIDRDFQLWTSLRTAQVVKVTQAKHFQHNYQVGGIKDLWRPSFVKWCREYYPWLKYDIIDPIVDKFGNSISSGTPKKLERKIKKQLLLPHFRRIEEVQNHVDDLELSVDMFYYDEDTKHMYARFSYQGEWWNYGVKHER